MAGYARKVFISISHKQSQAAKDSMLVRKSRVNCLCVNMGIIGAQGFEGYQGDRSFAYQRTLIQYPIIFALVCIFLIIVVCICNHNESGAAPRT